MAREMKSRYEGVWVRHRKGCSAPDGARCSCKPGPSYIARVYDRATRRKVASPSYPTAAAARSWRTDQLRAMSRGSAPAQSTVRVQDVVERFLRAAEDGTARTKRGVRYKPSAVRSLRGAFDTWVLPEIGTRRLDTVRRGDVQQIVDAMVGEGLSGSRVRNVVNSVRALHTFAIARDLCQVSPVVAIQLPAHDERPRDRVATPEEVGSLVAALLDPSRTTPKGRRLEPVELYADATAYALAAYTGARRAEIRHLTWECIDLPAGLVRLGEDERARKSRAARRAAPIMPALASLLRLAWVAQGQPADGLVCPARKAGGRNSGMLSAEALAARASTAWTDVGLAPIGLHECRHTCATWMDAAGVRPVVQAAILGHAPEGGISQSRYTHVQLEDVRAAGEQLARYLATPAARKAAS